MEHRSIAWDSRHWFVSHITWLFRVGALAATAASMLPAAAATAPTIFWASSPVGPGECVLVAGADLADITGVEIARLSDRSASDPQVPQSDFSLVRDGKRAPAPAVEGSQIVKPLQASDHSVKFIIPARWKHGVYAFRLTSGEAHSSITFLNAPDPWWMQADSGAAATPGGWLRIFGKSLSCSPGGPPPDTIASEPGLPKNGSLALLKGESGASIRLSPAAADRWSLRFSLADSIQPGKYTVFVHNGCGGNLEWARVGVLEVKARTPWPARVFNVMDFYGADKDKESRRTLGKWVTGVDRTEAVQAALKKAEANGGGVVYFPAGIYSLHEALRVPPHTLLQGEGMGRVSLWWGKGNISLDGGSSERRIDAEDKVVLPELITGAQFGIEELSLFLPRMYQTAIDAGDGFRMYKVRVRVDRYWIRPGEREDGLVLRMKDDSQVTDCDILSRGVGMTVGRNDVIARNRILAGKSNVSLEHSDGVIFEDNNLISLDPTAYINLSGEGRNLYYARNRHESFFAQQSDFSWTFDGTGMAYLGKIASTKDSEIELAADPQYPGWAGESHPLWMRSAVCILDGRGAGQYRFVTGNQGRTWTVDRPFTVPPDDTSIVSIVPFRGRSLVIDNRFEDASWVNMGYGSSIDIVCSGNQIYRAGSLLNLGLREKAGVMPSWFIQYFDNDVFEGQTGVESNGDERGPDLFSGTVTRWCVHRRQHIHADNSGSVSIGGNAADVVVEHCILDHPQSRIKVGKNTAGILLHANHLATTGAAGYEGDGLKQALIVNP